MPEHRVLRHRSKVHAVDVPKLPTTSYAVLGMLAIRSWTGYELTEQARRNLAYVWPKRDSVYYEEPRRLVDCGLATSTVEHVGRRHRNRYTITDAGREALARWLAQPSEPPALDNEAYLRLFLIDQGDLDSAQRTIHGVRTWAEERRQELLDVLEGYRHGHEPFPERRHVSILGLAVLLTHFDAYLEGADQLEREVETWQDTCGAANAPHTSQLLSDLLERYGR